jgi:hypothetical protein
MKILKFILAGSAALLMLAGCTAAPSSGVASLSSGGSNSSSGQSSGNQSARLKAAADCIRSHGAPGYQDPVVDPGGQVYTDSRTIQNLSTSQMDAIEQACHSLIAAAGFSPADEAPATPALIAAGVKSAQCLRANGLPNYKDPTSSSPFTPGHGFGLRASEMPNNGALGKADPALQRAFTACRKQLDAEVKASDLGSLAHG